MTAFPYQASAVSCASMKRDAEADATTESASTANAMAAATIEIDG